MWSRSGNTRYLLLSLCWTAPQTLWTNLLLTGLSSLYILKLSLALQWRQVICKESCFALQKWSVLNRERYVFSNHASAIFASGNSLGLTANNGIQHWRGRVSWSVIIVAIVPYHELIELKMSCWTKTKKQGNLMSSSKVTAKKARQQYTIWCNWKMSPSHEGQATTPLDSTQE